MACTTTIAIFLLYYPNLTTAQRFRYQVLYERGAFTTTP